VGRSCRDVRDAASVPISAAGWVGQLILRGAREPISERSLEVELVDVPTRARSWWPRSPG